MSSFARRGLRTTAAAVGLAAFGVGIAGQAFAAPAAPADPDSDSYTEQGAQTFESIAGNSPVDPTDRSAELPGLFQFKAPTINEPETPAPAATDSSGVGFSTVDGGTSSSDPAQTSNPSAVGSPLPGLPGVGGGLPLAGPSVPGLPGLPGPESLGSVSNTGGLADQVPTPDVDSEMPKPQTEVGAVPDLDGATSVPSLAQRVVSGSPTSGLNVR